MKQEKGKQADIGHKAKNQAKENPGLVKYGMISGIVFGITNN